MNTSKALRVAALVVIAALIVGIAPNRVSAARAGGSFESKAFGVTVNWDEDVWTGTVDDLGEDEGVAFESISSFGEIQAIHASNVDADDCLQRMSDFFAQDDGTQIEDFGVAPRRIERPEGIEGAAGELFTYTFVGGGGSLHTTLYLGCAALPDDLGALQIILSSESEVYPDAVQDWNELIGGVSIDGVKTTGTSRDPGTSTGKSAAKTGITGDTYTNAELKFSLAWDGDFWTASEISTESAQGVELDAGSSYAYIAAVTGDNAQNANDCFNVLASNLEGNDSFSRVRVASKSIDRPETVRKAVGDLYTFVSDDGVTKMVAYLECRPLATDGMLTLQFAANYDGYETELSQWQDVLDNVTLKTSGGAKKPTPTATPDHTGSGTAADAATVAGPNFGVEIAYDDTVWTANDYSDGATDQFGFDSDFGHVQVITVGVQPDLEGCVQTLADSETQYAVDGLTAAPRSLARPKTSRGAEVELYTLTIDADSGPVDALYYVECRATADGNGVVAVTFTTVPSVWDVALMVLEPFLAGIDA
jgi:hypothetical protein